MIIIHSIGCLIYIGLTLTVGVWALATKTYSSNYIYEILNYNMTMLPYSTPYYYNNSIKYTVNISEVDASTQFRVSTFGVAVALSGVLALRSSLLVVENFRVHYAWSDVTWAKNFGLIDIPIPRNTGYRPEFGLFIDQYTMPASYYSMLFQWLFLFLASTATIALICIVANLKFLITILMTCLANVIIWMAIVFWPLYRTFNVEYTDVDKKLFSRGLMEDEIKREASSGRRTSETEAYEEQVKRQNKFTSRNTTVLSIIQGLVVVGLFTLNVVQCVIQLPLLELQSQIAIGVLSCVIALEYIMLKYIMYREDWQRHKVFSQALRFYQQIPPESDYPAWSRFAGGTNNIPSAIWFTHELLLLVGTTIGIVVILTL